MEETFEHSVTRVGFWPAMAWSFVFVSIINLSATLGIVFLPLRKKKIFASLMRTMIGLAIGSLSGSALFHLIPGAFNLDQNRYCKDVATLIWLAIWIVMIVESCIYIYFEKYKSQFDQTRGGDGGKHDCENRNNLEAGITNGNRDVSEDIEDPQLTEMQNDKNLRGSVLSLEKRLQLDGDVTDMRRGEGVMKIKPVAWIIIIGDSIHNFIDGVSIGAAFTRNFREGMIISVAVMCEEFPHELGDFAILIRSGLHWKKALLFNFLSALTCYLGMIVGVSLGNVEGSNYVFAFAGGIFLYVALVEMVPEITESIRENGVTTNEAIWRLVSHHIGIAIGISLLYILAINGP